MNLRTALRIEPGDVVSLTGAGGKTSLMFRLAREIAEARLKVITTTTTKVGLPTSEQTPCFIVEPDREAMLSSAAQALLDHAHVTVVCAPYADGKFRGVPPDWVQDLRRLPDVHAVIVEADGARKLPLKAPRDNEPVVPSDTTLLVVCAGLTAIGTSLDEEHVCRAEQVGRLTGMKPGDTVRAEHIAQVLAHPSGGTKGRPPQSRMIALLNQADSDERLSAAREVARRLHTTGRFDETCIGTLGASSPVLERWGRATAVIMAAGEGRRFGAIKQMAPWRGTTYIEHAIQVAEQSQADEVLVVLGAHADQIRPTLKSMTTKTRIVMNERWLEGMSTSLIAGLGHTASKPSALIFMNVDQPAVTPLLIDRLIARHRVTGAAIVAPRFQGMRGNPTLWDRSLFGELRTLTGDVGGREILRQHWRDIAWIELDSEEELTDTDTPEEYQRLKEILRA